MIANTRNKIRKFCLHFHYNDFSVNQNQLKTNEPYIGKKSDEKNDVLISRYDRSESGQKKVHYDLFPFQVTFRFHLLSLKI